jgi:hypothetical protein
MVTFVSALVLPTNTYRTVDKYIQYFNQLASTGIPILLYLDESLRNYGKSLPTNVRVVEYVSARPPWVAVLPKNRTPEKDTVQYMQIQLRKLEFVTDALRHTDDEFLAWIDFGIYHMCKNELRWKQLLTTIAYSTFPKERLFSPGCWEQKEYSIWDTICWRFCGSFVLGHRSLFPRAFERQSELVVEGLPRLTWEVNYWTQMEDMFQVYIADHNDSLIEGLMEWIQPRE